MDSVRKAKLSDLPFVMALSKEAFSRYGRYDLSILKWFLTPDIYTFVCEKGDQGRAPCGFIMFAFMRPTGEEKPVLEIMAIAVSKESQRQGIGAKLINFVKRFRKALSVDGGPLKIRLSVAETNQSGRYFFEKCGFRPVAEATWRYPAGQKAIRMELQINHAVN